MSTGMQSWLIGIVVSGILAVVAYMIEHWSSENEARRAGINSALNMALLGVILTALIAYNFETREQLAQAVPHVKSQMLEGIVGDIVELDRAQGASLGNDRFREIMMDPLRQQLSHGISKAKQGLIVTESIAQTINLASDLMKEARQRLVMTSYIHPSEWWTTSAGADYSERTKEVPTRVSLFERIFIVDDESELRELREIMLEQRKRGMDIKYAYSTKVGKSLSRDFMIVDNLIAGEIILNQDRRFKEGRFYISKTVAEDYDEWFRQIRVWAREVR